MKGKEKILGFVPTKKACKGDGCTGLLNKEYYSFSYDNKLLKRREMRVSTRDVCSECGNYPLVLFAGSHLTTEKTLS